MDSAAAANIPAEPTRRQRDQKIPAWLRIARARSVNPSTKPVMAPEVAKALTLLSSLTTKLFAHHPRVPCPAISPFDVDSSHHSGVDTLTPPRRWVVRPSPPAASIGA